MLNISSMMIINFNVNIIKNLFKCIIASMTYINATNNGSVLRLSVGIYQIWSVLISVDLVITLKHIIYDSTVRTNSNRQVTAGGYYLYIQYCIIINDLDDHMFLCNAKARIIMIIIICFK